MATPARGRVVAATVLEYPAPGFPPGHGLALIEVDGPARLLVTSGRHALRPGDVVAIERDGEVYVATPDV